MAGDYLKRVERVRIKMDFMKKLRVRGAATFQIQTPRVWGSILLNVRQWRKFVYETGLNNNVDQAHRFSKLRLYVIPEHLLLIKPDN